MDQLDEMYLGDILKGIIPGDLPHRDYVHLLKKSVFKGFYSDNTTRFVVPSRYNAWNNYIMFEQWEEQVKDLSLKPFEAARLIIAGADTHIYCDCPSYLFHGYQYIDTQLGIEIKPEDRAPHIRNPYMKGLACKHLRKTLPVVSFYLADIAAEIKRQRMRH